MDDGLYCFGGDKEFAVSRCWETLNLLLVHFMVRGHVNARGVCG